MRMIVVSEGRGMYANALIEKKKDDLQKETRGSQEGYTQVETVVKYLKYQEIQIQHILPVLSQADLMSKGLVAKLTGKRPCPVVTSPRVNFKPVWRGEHFLALRTRVHLSALCHHHHDDDDATNIVNIRIILIIITTIAIKVISTNNNVTILSEDSSSSPPLKAPAV